MHSQSSLNVNVPHCWLLNRKELKNMITKLYDIIKKNANETLLVCAVGVVSVLPSQAASTAITSLTNQQFTNFPGLPQGPLKVTQFLIANNTTNAQTVYFWDVPTNSVTNVVPSYVGTTQVLSNWPFILTNYYGNIVTNTNVVLVDQLVTNVSVTNNISPKLIMTATANSSTKADTVSYYFYSGLWMSNSVPPGTNSGVAISITYQ